MPGHHRRHAGLARARRDRRRADEQREQGNAHRAGRALILARDVARLDMAELVRDHALQLVVSVGLLDRARVDVDELAAGDERVDVVVADQQDLERTRLEPGRFRQAGRDLLEEMLGLGIAQHLLRQRRLHREHHRHQGSERDAEQADQAAHGQGA